MIRFIAALLHPANDKLRTPGAGAYYQMIFSANCVSLAVDATWKGARGHRVGRSEPAVEVLRSLGVVAASYSDVLTV